MSLAFLDALSAGILESDERWKQQSGIAVSAVNRLTTSASRILADIFLSCDERRKICETQRFSLSDVRAFKGINHANKIKTKKPD